LAIAYGYMKGDEHTLKPSLRKVLEEAEAFETCYDDDVMGEDPACLPYDLTSDPVEHSEEEFHRYAETQARLLNMTVPPGESYTHYGNTVSDLLFKVETSAVDLLGWVGGVHDRYVHRSNDGRRGRLARRPVPASIQRRALAQYLQVLRPARAGLLPPPDDIGYLVWAEGAPASIGHVQTLDLAQQARDMIGGLVAQALSPWKVQQIYNMERIVEAAAGARAGATAAPALFGLGDFLVDFVSGVVGEGLDVSEPSEWHLHRELVRSLKSLYREEGMPEEVISHVLFHLQRLSDAAESAYERLASHRHKGGWQDCSKEGETCDCNGLVRYGVKEAWSAAVAVVNSTVCSNSRFGDPRPDATKRCECLASAPGSADLRHAHFRGIRKELAEVLCEDLRGAADSDGNGRQKRQGFPCSAAD